MAYNSYKNLKKVVEKFGIKVEGRPLFQNSDIRQIQPSQWRFMKFENQTLTIHPTYYYLSNLPLLLGVFAHLIDDCRTFKI